MKQEQKANTEAKKYRAFRESCGVKDPIMLDEIEDAYYNGFLDAYFNRCVF